MKTIFSLILLLNIALSQLAGPSLQSPSNGATGIDKTSIIVLDWSNVINVGYYDVEVQSSASFNNPIFSERTSPSFSSIPANTLNYNTKYYWRVVGHHTQGPWNGYPTAWSTTSSFTTAQAGPPNIPTNLVATPSEGQVVLTWTANSEGNLASYKVYGGTSANPTTLLASISAGTETYTDSNVNNGTTYYYRISAVNDEGIESDMTSDVSALPLRVFTPIISSTKSSPTNALSIPITVTFDEKVTDFISSDITLNNASLQNFSNQSEITNDTNCSITTSKKSGNSSSLNDFELRITDKRVYYIGETFTLDMHSDIYAFGQGSVTLYQNETLIKNVGWINTSNSTATFTISSDITPGSCYNVRVSGTVGDRNYRSDPFTIAISTNDDIYTFDLEPKSDGNITVDISEGVAKDINNNPNSKSNQFLIVSDRTAPIIGTVNDGRTADIDTLVSNRRLNANWSGFTDNTSGINFYEWAIGTASGGTDIQNWKNVEKATFASYNDTELVYDQVYYISVRATDNAGNYSIAKSDGIRIYDSNRFVENFGFANFLSGWTNTANSTGDRGWYFVSSNSDSHIAFDNRNGVARSDIMGAGAGDQLSRSFTFTSRVFVDLWFKGLSSTSAIITFKVDGQEYWNYKFNTPTSGNKWIKKSTLIEPGMHTISIESSSQGSGSLVYIDDLQIGTNIAPIPSIISSAGTHTNTTPIPIDIIFSIPVTGFTAEDINVSGASKSNFSGSDNTYSLKLNPVSEGPITIDIPNEVAQDIDEVYNESSEDLIIFYDVTSPTVSLSSSLDSPIHSSSIPIDIIFSEPVINFNWIDDLNIYNSEVIGGTFSGSDSLYAIKLKPLNDGLVRFYVKDQPTDYTDLAGNPPADFQNPFEIYYDNLPPAIVLTDPVNSGTLDTLIVEWVASDTSKIDKFELYTSYNSQSYSLSDSVSGETFSYNLILPNQIITQNQIMIKATDQWGLFSYDTSATFTISDNDPPVVSILSPVQITSVNEYDSLLVKWLATDNLSIDVTKIFLSIDGGSNYKEVASELDSTIQSKKIKIPMGLSTAAMIKVSSIDASGNTGYSESETFTIIDNTPPTVSLSSPEPNDQFEIGTPVTINWVGEDNVAVEDIKIAYSMNLGSDWDDVLIAKNNINQTYQWIMPNIISSNIMLRTVVFDAVGLSDTAIVNNIISYPMYPTIVSIEPTAGVLRWLEEDISITFNRAMDSASFTQQNVIINTLRSNAPEINYIANDKKLVIHKSGGYSSLDTIQIQLKANGLLSTFGYAMDGNNNSLPGGDSTLAYHSLMLADFDTTNGIDGSDLAIMLDALDNKDNAYDIGPVINSVPYFLVQPDNKLDIEDIMSFAMMWNWYSESNSLGKIEGPAINPVDIQYDHRGIAIKFPNNATIAEVYIQNASEELSYRIVDDPYFISMEYYDQKLNRLSYLAEKNRDGALEIPFTIKGKRIDMDITYRFVDRFGKVVSFESQTLEIENVPKTFSLYQNYPNPFNPVTTIFYDLPVDTDIELAIYDITGRKVSVLVNEYQIKGYRSFKWNGKDSNGKKLGSGLYFYQLQAKNFIKTKKMIMLK